jgi:hypothetical protein
MNGLAKFVTEELQRQSQDGRPGTTLADLVEALQYPRHRVLKGILDARAEGAPIYCRMVPGEPSVFAVETRPSATVDDAPSSEGQ